MWYTSSRKQQAAENERIYKKLRTVFGTMCERFGIPLFSKLTKLSTPYVVKNKRKLSSSLCYFNQWFWNRHFIHF